MIACDGLATQTTDELSQVLWLEVVHHEIIMRYYFTGEEHLHRSGYKG